MNMLYCDACDKKIAVDNESDFNYTNDCKGPYCDVCWFFVERIQKLEDNVESLAEQLANG